MGETGHEPCDSSLKLGVQLVNHAPNDLGHLGDYRIAQAPESGDPIGHLAMYGARYATLPDGYSTSVKPGGKPIRASTHAGFSLPPVAAMSRSGFARFSNW